MTGFRVLCCLGNENETKLFFRLFFDCFHTEVRFHCTTVTSFVNQSSHLLLQELLLCAQLLLNLSLYFNHFHFCSVCTGTTRWRFAGGWNWPTNCLSVPNTTTWVFRIFVNSSLCCLSSVATSSCKKVFSVLILYALEVRRLVTRISPLQSQSVWDIARGFSNKELWFEEDSCSTSNTTLFVSIVISPHLFGAPVSSHWHCLLLGPHELTNTDRHEQRFPSRCMFFDTKRYGSGHGSVHSSLRNPWCRPLISDCKVVQLTLTIILLPVGPITFRPVSQKLLTSIPSLQNELQHVVHSSWRVYQQFIHPSDATNLQSRSSFTLNGWCAVSCLTVVSLSDRCTQCRLWWSSCLRTGYSSFGASVVHTCKPLCFVTSQIGRTIPSSSMTTEYWIVGTLMKFLQKLAFCEVLRAHGS